MLCLKTFNVYFTVVMFFFFLSYKLSSKSQKYYSFRKAVFSTKKRQKCYHAKSNKLICRYVLLLTLGSASTDPYQLRGAILNCYDDIMVLLTSDICYLRIYTCDSMKGLLTEKIVTTRGLKIAVWFYVCMYGWMYIYIYTHKMPAVIICFIKMTHDQSLFSHRWLPLNIIPCCRTYNAKHFVWFSLGILRGSK